MVQNENVFLPVRIVLQRPRWSSARDQDILASKVQITKAPSRMADQELYAPLYRNVSMFIRLTLISVSVLREATIDELYHKTV